jgi:hypothetical protein
MTKLSGSENLLQATGMRTVSKPAAFTAFSSSCVTTGLPHTVSSPGAPLTIASRELPRFQPNPICRENATASLTGTMGAELPGEGQLEPPLLLELLLLLLLLLLEPLLPVPPTPLPHPPARHAHSNKAVPERMLFIGFPELFISTAHKRVILEILHQGASRP